MTNHSFPTLTLVYQCKYLLRLLAVFAACCLFFELSACDSTTVDKWENQDDSEFRSDSTAQYRPDTTYSPAAVNHVWFSGLEGTVLSNQWAFAFNDHNAITVLVRAGRDWLIQEELVVDRSWFTPKPVPDFEAYYFDRGSDAYDDRYLVSATQDFSYDAPSFDFFHTESTALVFEWDGLSWKATNLFKDEPLPEDVFVVYLSMGSDVAVVGVSGPGIEGKQAIVFQRTAEGWIKSTIPGFSSAIQAKVASHQLLLWEYPTRIKVVRKVAGLWNSVAQIITPSARGIGGRFTNSVAADTYTLAIGNIRETVFVDPSVQVLERNSNLWTTAASLSLDKNAAAVGVAVDTDDDFLALTVGFGGGVCNVVYVYERVRNRWINVDAIRPSPSEFAWETGCGQFGERLSIAGGSLAVSGGGTVHFYSWTAGG